eukprot:385537_1
MGISGFTFGSFHPRGDPPADEGLENEDVALNRAIEESLRTAQQAHEPGRNPAPPSSSSSSSSPPFSSSSSPPFPSSSRPSRSPPPRAAPRPSPSARNPSTNDP